MVKLSISITDYQRQVLQQEQQRRIEQGLPVTVSRLVQEAVINVYGESRKPRKAQAG